MTAAANHGPVGWLLALHSSTETFGVALQPLGQRDGPRVLEAFPLGRALSNDLMPCVEAVLPAREWPHLARLAVATGPGGFTGTRLSVAMARTLCQQLGLPLDGISSFQLVARRLLGENPTSEPVILSQVLPRHGMVAGLYRMDPDSPGGVAELVPPRLYRQEDELHGVLGNHSHVPAQPQLPEDVGELLTISQETARLGRPAPWASVVPLYPTSPVEPQ